MSCRRAGDRESPRQGRDNGGGRLPRRDPVSGLFPPSCLEQQVSILAASEDALKAFASDHKVGLRTRPNEEDDRTHTRSRILIARRSRSEQLAEKPEAAYQKLAGKDPRIQRARRNATCSRSCFPNEGDADAAEAKPARGRRKLRRPRPGPGPPRPRTPCRPSRPRTPCSTRPRPTPSFALPQGVSAAC